MVAYNFQAQFAPLILSGVKRSTLRMPRKRDHAKPADPLHLFTGMRSDACTRLMDVPCEARNAIDLHATGVRVNGAWRTNPTYFDTLAQIEGFDSFGNLQAWFDRQYGLPVLDLTQLTWCPKMATYRAASRAQDPAHG